MKNSWAGKRVLILGAARQGMALARYLVTSGAIVTLNDQRPAEQMNSALQALRDLPIQWVLGGHPLGLLEDMDAVAISGGVPLEIPLIAAARERGTLLTNDTQVFLSEVPCPVIGITGSAGKTTTTTLVGRIASKGITPPNRVWVGGNIGTPLVEELVTMAPGDLVVLELSSFQLELLTYSPQVAAILNITPNHLDRHGSMEAYTRAKGRILDFQTAEDTAVINREDPGARSLTRKVKGNLVSFGLSRLPSGECGTFVEENTLYIQQGSSVQEIMPRGEISLRGEHNLLNVLAASAIAVAANLPLDAIHPAVAGFAGVEHRLELVGCRNGVCWYNDSIATAPERSMAAIRSFDEHIVLLAGGRDKNLPWEEFARLVHQKVDHLVLFGEAASKIYAAVGSPEIGALPQSITLCKSLREAVHAAEQVSQPGDVVLLSPGGTSYDEFRDFEERGERYREWVKERL